jgi:hypothetical protein
MLQVLHRDWQTLVTEKVKFIGIPGNTSPRLANR